MLIILPCPAGISKSFRIAKHIDREGTKKSAQKAKKAQDMLLMAKYGYEGVHIDGIEEEVEAAKQAEKAKPMKLKEMKPKPKP